jgi:BlaI family transcriptional regulator, penicillinase repressor
MAKKKAMPRLSAGEIEIMAMLWERGSVSLAEAHRAVAANRPIGYTTIQTRLNRLVSKGVVGRTCRRPARYEALVPPDAVGARHIDVLLEKIRGFRVVPLVAHLIRDRSLTPAEVAALKELIAEAEEASRRRER